MLQKLVDILWAILKGAGLIKEQIDEAKAKQKVEDALEKRDQTGIEETMGGSTGPTKRKYFGLFTRPREEKKDQ